MRQRHIPYGYRIINGKALIDENQAEQVRRLFAAYLSGKSYMDAGKSAGFELTHSSVKGLLQNRYYLGDDFYPPIISRETYDAAEAERQRRAKHLGRIWEKQPQVKKGVPTLFNIGLVEQNYKDPYEQASYIYSLIESEE